MSSQSPIPNLQSPTRYPELDLLRGIAVLCMIVYHLLYDLETFYGYDIGIHGMLWTLFARSTAGLFLLLVGIGFAISWDRRRVVTSPEGIASSRWKHLYGKYLKRGLGLILCGMLVSVVTYATDPVNFVRFGILHLIGTSILLLPFFVTLRTWAAIPGILITIFGFAHGPWIIPTTLLLPLGGMPQDFFSVDYFPLIPWFGIVLTGYGIGRPYHRWRSSRRLAIDGWRLEVASWPGRHALIIYLVHQPILLTGLWLVMRSSGR